jgi:N-acyl-D-aspartate/D-glutamate deacylase
MSKAFSVFLIWLMLAPMIPAKPQAIDDRYDLVIINARIVDGTGNPWFRGSVAIKDGRIAKVGFFDTSQAKNTIDAKNQIVAPGFIDVHTHVEDI